MRFTNRELTGIPSGEIAVALRRWRSPRVRTGSKVRTPIGLVEIVSITELPGSADLDEEKVAEIDRRLDRMDRAADTPWTRETLRLIAARPGIVSTELAAGMGLERLYFKQRVRRLKELGLTESLEVGYRLSPRGQTYLEAIA